MLETTNYNHFSYGLFTLESFLKRNKIVLNVMLETTN